MNRLSNETSPYLKQHASNPVDWYPWGQEAFERARRESRPILLSVGYSACHWCHVMAHESFENPAIAKLMNAHFVNVKVDREERPEVDALYQGVVQLMGRGGGWPLTVFLTPDLRPFYGGTYFPPADRHGLPGFPKILTTLAEAWKSRPGDVESQAQAFRDGLLELSTSGLDAQLPSRLEIGAPTHAFTSADIVRCAEALESAVDRENGGFGGRPKFPNPMNVALLLRGWRRTGNEQLRSAALLSLERMAEGGLYDQLGGGFHRYSVDERWLVPHFEKMLYDNAQLLHLYSEAQQVEPRRLWWQVVSETVLYLGREMVSPEGAFYTAQDADSEGEEGKYFVWTPAELDALLPPEQASLARLHFGVTEEGNFEHGTTVLAVHKRADALAAETGRPVEEIHQLLGMARCKLLGARMKRVAPGRDDKILSGWNGLMIRGLAFAARVFDKPEWTKMAQRAADHILEVYWKDGRLLRTARAGKEGGIEGFLEDYGDFAAGLVSLFQATHAPRYLEVALELVKAAHARFWDADRQAYLTAAKGHSELPIQGYSVHDNAWPSGASTLTEAQVALAALTGDAGLFERATTYLSRMRDSILENPFAFGHLLLAADTAADGAAEVSIHGAEASRAALVKAVNQTYAPTVTLVEVDRAVASSEALAKTLEGRNAPPDGAAAYLCRHFACQPPVFTPEHLRAALAAR